METQKVQLVSMTPLESQAVWELRTLLRDQCLDGSMCVSLKVEAERDPILIRLDQLFEILDSVQT